MANSKRRHKSLKITQSARNEECQVRLDLRCNFNPETTIFAQLGGAGMGVKSSDILGTYCCSSCHSIIDGHTESHLMAEEVEKMFYEGIFRTQQILLDKGLIKI